MGNFSVELERFQKDVQSRDILWSLFVAAAKSYRFSSVLHPFPGQYCIEDSDQKNIVLLREEAHHLPALDDCEALCSVSQQGQDLLTWVLDTKQFELQLADKHTCWKEIVGLTGQLIETPQPSFIFKVIPTDAKEEKFQSLRDGRETFFAYHGSRLDNFHSILHNGLNGHLNKTAVFGEGTYLSSELSVCFMYSPAGDGWKKSMLAPKLSCVVVCELIDDPSVKCQVKDGTLKEKRTRAQASSHTDSVPEKYYVVKNNDMIRIRYLLVYKAENTQRCQSQSRFGWVKEYKFALIMLCYAMLLVAIGLANSPQTLKKISKIYHNLRH